jgi:hypothetical protein
MLRKLLLAMTVAILAFGTAGAAFGGIAGPTVPLTPPPSAAPQGVLAYRSPTVATPQLFFAVVGNHVLTGRSRPNALGAGGAVVLRDEEEPQFSCMGAYGYAAKPQAWASKAEGRAQFECSDGSRFELAYHGVSDDAGVGRGAADGAVISLCYGFPARSAMRHLIPPPGYVLVVDRNLLALKRSGA